MNLAIRLSFLVVFLFVFAGRSHAREVEVSGRLFTIPDGYDLQLVTTHELTKRPIVVDFDSQGNLYVAESSGTNDNVQTQLNERPHSILRLTDSDGDGVFDQKTVFADRMMFPEGAMWLDGSLYVSAPPQIWKLTDTDDDGVADERQVWFDGKTLTGCANDLHGPYAGIDGWIYWCKGAFAEQTHELPNRSPLVSRAAHIFRRRPEGGPLEHVMTGGMDNPVELVFLPNGERIFDTTFFQHPGNGQRDGLIHAIYGGVYGKRHGVLDGHPRTGDLMPVLTQLGAAAPSGLVRLRSEVHGFQGQLLTACFNLHTVMRHELTPVGATYQTQDMPLVTSNDLDFHPTDVIEDADGSILIVDTGGWYKLCCPTSQLHKPDVLGGIYRLKRSDASRPDDPRGHSIDFASRSVHDLIALLDDSRPAVCDQAMAQLSSRGKSAIGNLASVLTNEKHSAMTRVNVVWTLCRTDYDEARAAIRLGLEDSDSTVRHASIHAVSVWRDGGPLSQLHANLADGDAPLKRAAAEAIGRIGKATSVRKLLDAIETSADTSDRVLQHSLTYALIEIGATPPLLDAIADDDTQLAALLALNAIPNAQFDAEQICGLFSADDTEVRDLAVSIAVKHSEWRPQIIAAIEAAYTSESVQPELLAQQLAAFDELKPVRGFINEILPSDDSSQLRKRAILFAVDPSAIELSTCSKLLKDALSRNDEESIERVVTVLDGRDLADHDDVQKLLAGIATAENRNDRLRMKAIAVLRSNDDQYVQFLLAKVDVENLAATRAMAASTIASLRLTDEQLKQLAERVPDVGPLEIEQVISAFNRDIDQSTLLVLLNAVSKSPFASSLSADRLMAIATNWSDTQKALVRKAMAKPDASQEEKVKRIDQMLASLPSGDIRRGQKIFHGEKTACFSCHAVGYRGGTVGPDLSRIGRIRSKRDLLESVLYPSASFVRSYEPIVVVTVGGKQFAGTVRDKTGSVLTLQLNATEQHSIAMSDIEALHSGTVSIMPEGLDKLLSEQEFADLLEFLMSRN
ncbi:MAG: c-type cytochrome [Planctomycetales bacterium]|nr:c-type cytochrome [Planctomycetales bacterium]